MASTVPRSRSLWRMLTIDPSNIPLLAVMSGVFGGVGYMVGHKSQNAVPDKNVRLASENPHPWHQDDPKDADYKYKYKKGAHPEGEELHAPSAMSVTHVSAKLDKDLHDKLPSGMKTDQNKESS
ncbi:hypothetical protein K493DRAFT_302996 [Basidiobolus meristosporus CBS 931.73]|uniref:Uncharacterized protein n=1 Tax=Basidiobolus meristosporus CBS 931.73 TaxID=1314790 RepID=A0A1Y1Y4I9_9FUNG|nr:hypothetical protein K493DRAFT_302996 [Basidiobolus meristosporus CBS 931.73]|eukprot:ORX92942.1 hypothetical protein K493DRAFT_302996 [Basidiobolus meristosporus CBS 931.73]